MTLDEKLAQLVGYWVDQGDEVVAPMAGEMATSTRYDDATTHGLGHLTRVYGTRPVDPVERAEWLWGEQRRLQQETRLGIPAIVHEESLTGLAAWKAATFPTPLAWGAAFDPDLVERMGHLIGESMRELGVHQTLAPVLDVIRDPRWGRVDECIAEDPYVVGTIGTAYVRGMQDAGVHATLKHFVGYSLSHAGRNHAPVHIGEREMRDVMLPPFEMAVREGGVRSVMNSYTEIDGVPVASDPTLLTDLLRGEWGFDGVVVSDYFAVAFLHTMHAVAADRGEAAALALAAGIDVELPTGDAYLEPLAERVRAGLFDEALVDRSVLRVLAQKEDLGLLDATFDAPPTAIDLDTPAHRAVARELAEESVVLLANDGVLPLASPRRIAVIGPNADDERALFGCYSFLNHVLAHHPDVPSELEAPTLRTALGEQFRDAEICFAVGADVEGDDRSGFADAVASASGADVAIVVVGDRAGLFGRGTVGEGNDVESLDLPGVQRELVEAVAATGTPVVMVLLTGRPYAIDWALDGSIGAVVQAFFPGEEGGHAIAGILSGSVTPSGRLPISLPRSAGAQPYSYLHPILGGANEITSADSTPLRPFGFGLSYTSFAHSDLRVDPETPTDGEIVARVQVRNTGDRAGTDVVQLYGRDVYASVTRPVAQLLGYRRVPLQPGEQAEVTFRLPASQLAFTGRDLRRIVEPGLLKLWVGPDCETMEATAELTLTGPVNDVTGQAPAWVRVEVEPGVGPVDVDAAEPAVTGR
ncbi:glycoside hydrolase family 3 C-terminal domain-containing protein [Microbacterium sp. zg.Y1090]|uniref:beta-xylosidase/alpha-l-arabinosidase n=1 Tax=Microbacterium TaxID=33882 RepID=UPI00214CA3BF|nr:MULTISPECIES: glycoside hydrolase family 3 N-terminal domain-containing protein [unclassified Microbacterium]MCR2813229.1 glycoside hydrolase family 3 C-terminal domain-containing protein [Microbacterium sp. zg.Y1084]MCR2819542.1 glycoside hydrolase family 3 C-terminal domain-containing protein [Microbacterium sp. zg.Y1090]MDL5487396.1 glycoside hydrolase family 3 N-terminal domain-containing protein [Microbacterium sp. zg-Y1211]WIM29804.1 glycoside hydrolase family 3 N-terminal domain-conta